MRDLPLSALRAFAAVYESGGVRPAARRLDVAHSAVSRHVRELEAWLGVDLIDTRTGARAVFTPHGHALGRAASSGLSELARAVDAVRELRRANSVAIATTASFGARWLIPRLPAFQREHPWIEVSIIAQQSVLNLSDQGADMALRMGAGPWEEGEAEPLMDDGLYPVASQDYWGRLSGRTPGQKLAKARLLHDRDPSAAWESWFAEHKSAGADVRAGPRFTSSDLVLRAAAAGLGVALARDRLAQDDVSAGMLVRPFGGASVILPRAYWLILPSGGAVRPAERAMITWLRAQAAQLAS
jgi:LysR family transcriptional regulator, glycine cleavage system transcriptional activator